MSSETDSLAVEYVPASASEREVWRGALARLFEEWEGMGADEFEMNKHEAVSEFAVK